MHADEAQTTEEASVSATTTPTDALQWHCTTRVDKYAGDTTDPAALIDTIEVEGNLLMYGGASTLWQYALGNGTTTADQALTYLTNARAALGVGDSNTAAAATQTDLQAATNKLRKAMDATYPQHTDGVVVGSASVTFRSTFGTSEANWVWNEWGLFNTATAATGRMINRKVESLGTKASGSTWVLTVTLSLA